MAVNVNQYRAAIGTFNNRSFITTKKYFYATETKPLILWFYFFFFFIFTVYIEKYRKNRFKSIILHFVATVFCFYHTWFYIQLVNLSGDVEKNPGPKSYSAQYLTICHWKLNNTAGLTPPSYAKRVEVLVFDKSYLPLKLNDIKYLHECKNFESETGGKIFIFLALYRSPSQNRD